MQRKCTQVRTARSISRRLTAGHNSIELLRKTRLDESRKLRAMNASLAPPSITDVLKKISDDKALSLFNSIAISRGFRNIILREMNLSPKQYYSRLSGLVDAGLIRKFEGRYLLTLVGKIVYNAQINIGKALSYYWKLKAIE